MLDTNVVVSALIWGGGPYKLLQLATEGRIELFTSPVLLAELREVLARDHLSSRLEQQRSSVEAALGFQGELARIVSPLTSPRVVPTDADDDHVIAAALAARAHLIVTGDRDFLILGHHKSLTISTVTQALQQVSDTP